MIRVAAVLAALVWCLSAAPRKEASRPHIYGISRVQIYSSNIPAARTFYKNVLNQAHDCSWCEDLPANSFFLSNLQAIGLSASPSPAPADLLEEITFTTSDVPQLRRYFQAHGITVSKPAKPEDNHLTVTDPDGHLLGFAQLAKYEDVTARFAKVGIPYEPHIIHAGFIVKDREAEDHFFKDLLGFHLYWQGGMKDDEKSWVAMQVPDGTDWVEYMLNISPTADRHTVGVMNHIALGVTDIQKVAERLREAGVVPILEEPKLGRDGKWQLNLYDPDETRVEFMEFTPKEKPCCSEFTGRHPEPAAPPSAPTKP
jgi:catechol 2,3-dioxygenase-like lactoylglutathione lyase family enzyme